MNDLIFTSGLILLGFCVGGITETKFHLSHFMIRKYQRQISEKEIVNQLINLPKGLLIGMFIESSSRLCKTEFLNEDYYWHALFDHEIPEALATIANRKPEAKE